MNRRKIKSFSLFPGYSWYVPGISGMFALLGLFLAGAVLGNITVIVLTQISPEMAQTYGIMISYPVMFIPPLLYASFQSRRNALFETGYAMDSSNFGKFGGISIALAVSIATIALAFIMDWFSTLLPPIPESLKNVFETMLDGPVWMTLILVSVFAPFFEEMLCRGLVLRGLLQKMNPTWAIVVSALFFAFIHMNPWQAIPAFALGLLFGYVYYRTGSLKLTMLMHSVNNTLCVVTQHIEAFRDAESFTEAMSPVNYWPVFAMCTVMVAYFIYRMQNLVELPLGQNNACDVIRSYDEADDAVNG